MKKVILFGILGWLLSGCATTYPKWNASEKDFEEKPLAITLDVPYVEQSPSLCGPTALYMVSKPMNPRLHLEEVKQLTLSPKLNGAYKQDVLSAARRLGFAPYPLTSFSSIVDTLAAEKPVILFHRTRFLWKDYWHFSVITGYDRRKESFYLHIGPWENKEVKFSEVVGSWIEGGSWSYVIMKAGEMPTTVSHGDALENSLAFLRLGQADAAYELSAAILKRWPERYEANVVMADALMKKNEVPRALSELKAAFRKNPDNVALKQKIRELDF